MRDRFSRFASVAAQLTGTFWATFFAALILVVWAITGPIFGFSNTWQLVINTGTGIVTFLMVFLIQNAQNRQSRATQLKLDELLRAIEHASNRLIDIEEDGEEDLDRLQRVFERRANHVRSNGSKNQHSADKTPVNNQTNSAEQG